MRMYYRKGARASANKSLRPTGAHYAVSWLARDEGTALYGSAEPASRTARRCPRALLSVRPGFVPASLAARLVDRAQELTDVPAHGPSTGPPPPNIAHLAGRGDSHIDTVVSDRSRLASGDQKAPRRARGARAQRGCRPLAKAVARRAAPARREKSGEGTCAGLLVPFWNVPFLAGDSVVDRRRLHCRLNSLRKPGRFPCSITRRRGVRLCLMARRTFLAGT